MAQYKYVVNVEGNCAALRLKYLLAGPSAVFFVHSDEIEWFYPLLKPFVHYIPVTFRRTGTLFIKRIVHSCVCCWEEDRGNPILVTTTARYKLIVDG